jgi:hypothetical protein
MLSGDERCGETTSPAPRFLDKTVELPQIVLHPDMTERAVMSGWKLDKPPEPVTRGR